MFKSLNFYSKSRILWAALSLTALMLELIALYFQYVLLLNPCVLCIYQRCALCGIIVAGVVGAIAPTTPLRFVGLVIWLYSAWQGLLLAMKHTNQLHPSPFSTCDFYIKFPAWLPLDKWFPLIFNASSDCITNKWNFLPLQMPQWMILIFAVYLLIAIIILLAQFLPIIKRKSFFC